MTAVRTRLRTSASLLRTTRWAMLSVFLGLLAAEAAWGQLPQFPPRIPGNRTQFEVSSDQLLMRPEAILDEVVVAKTPPQVEFRYYPGQDYEGRPWSVWGDGLVNGDVYYSAIGDHLAPEGNAYVYRFDAESGAFDRIVDVRDTLDLPEGHYTPGKIHSRLTIGRDGCLYFSTHRGSTRVTTPANHFSGDWILRHDLRAGTTDVVVHAPLPNQCLPTGRLDPQRMLFYAGTADGDYRNKHVQFLVYDVGARRVQFSADDGPYRAMILVPQTGRVYFPKGGGRGELVPLVCYDPQHPRELRETKVAIGLRAASQPTRDGVVYTVDGNHLWAFETRMETARDLGATVVGSENYITSLDLDPHSERYLYYVPGAHGGAYRDGSPLVQYDLQTRQRKVICFLDPALREAGFVPMGSYSIAINEGGDTVFITWNGAQVAEDADPQARLRFNTCGLTVIRIPESERAGGSADAASETQTSADSSRKAADVEKPAELAFRILTRPKGEDSDQDGLDKTQIAQLKQSLAAGRLAGDRTLWVPVSKTLEDVPLSGTLENQRYALVSREPAASLEIRDGKGIRDAQLSAGRFNKDSFDVSLEFDAQAAKQMRSLTRNFLGRRLGVIVNGELVMAPTIRAEIGERAMITGNFTKAEAQALVDSLEPKADP